MGAIVDSGERREFSTGAVRDIQEGKGRCDLLPLDTLEYILPMTDYIPLMHIEQYKQTNEITHIADAVYAFAVMLNVPIPTLLLEVSVHFEDGCKKYGENNWKKGIPLDCYIDSATRHYLKYLRKDTDERHDRAFVWNLLCLIWTHKNL